MRLIEKIYSFVANGLDIPHWNSQIFELFDFTNSNSSFYYYIQFCALSHIKARQASKSFIQLNIIIIILQPTCDLIVLKVLEKELYWIYMVNFNGFSRAKSALTKFDIFSLSFFFACVILIRMRYQKHHLRSFWNIYNVYYTYIIS